MIFLLMLSSLLQDVYGSVYVYDVIGNKTIFECASMPALFGPELPSSGFKGFLLLALPNDACSKIVRPPNVTGHHAIALVYRYGCSFVTKVKNAQDSGFGAVVVRNVDSNEIENFVDPMSGDDGTPIFIPSVFISQDDGVILEHNFLYSNETRYLIIITDDLPFNLQSYLIPFAITICLCFAIMIVFMVVKCIRDCKRTRRNRLPYRALKKLPLHKFKKGDPYECCAICLEDYTENDKLRILPCSHAYHTKCIDPWLTKNRRVCPVCKRKVFTSDERPSDLESDSDDEQTPLVSGSNTQTSGGTFTEPVENPLHESEARRQQRHQERQERRRRCRRPLLEQCSSDRYQRLEEDSAINQRELTDAASETCSSTGGDCHSDSVSLISNGSSSSSGTVPSACLTPIQIAVDVVNIVPCVAAASGTSENAPPEGDYVV